MPSRVCTPLSLGLSASQHVGMRAQMADVCMSAVPCTWEKVGRAAGEVAQQRSMRDTQAAGASVSFAGLRFPEATPEKMAGSVSPG